MRYGCKHDGFTIRVFEESMKKAHKFQGCQNGLFIKHPWMHATPVFLMFV